MQVSSIKNVSDKGVLVKAKNGMEVFLPPGQRYQDINVINLEEIKEKVEFVSNLTEVGKGDENSNRVKLND